MSVINMKPYVADILKNTSGLKTFGTSYPKKWEIFPIAIYRTVQKPAAIDHNGNELQTQWSITVEIYSDTGSLTNITDEIESKFNKIGFTGSSKDANTAGLVRRVSEFKAIVDNKTRMVFSK